MKKVTITSLLALTIVCPSFAAVDIAKNPQTDPGCTNSVLKTYDGPAALEADYTANTINLNFYSDENTVYSTGTCTYDGGIELPEEDPTRTGYTFDGWQVRRAAANNNNNNNQTPITLSSLYSSETINVFSSKSLNPGEYCVGSSGWDNENGGYLWYGSNEGGSCSDSAFTGLNNGEWRVTMPNGSVVKGEARCSTVGEGYEYAQTGNPTDDLDLNDLENSGAEYCWCKATSADSGNGYQPVSSSSWVFVGDYGDADGCAYNCANDCASNVLDGSVDFRRAVFGVTE